MTKEDANTANITADPVLGVRRSVMGQMWVERPHIPRIAEAIAERLDIPLVAARLMAGRGVSIDGADSFMDPQLRDLMPNPSDVKDMDRAAKRVVNAVKNGEHIAIFGDYDVDGATSSSILSRFFTALGTKVTTYIPDRIVEGYGPNANALLKLQNTGASLVITVDCGTLSYEPLQVASDAGLDVIVVDHHKAETKLPAAIAVVNPNRLDDTSEGLGQLAAVGVAFLLMVAVNRSLRADGYYTDSIKEPNLLQWLDLVALGTVCDVVPLTGLNRALVRQGLKVLARRQNVGLTALADVGRVNQAPTTYHLGFVMGPRVNAGGRVGEAAMGTKLLTANDLQEALALAEELDRYNSERKVIEAEVLQAALKQMDDKVTREGKVPAVCVAAGEGWHPGVIGIVASRLKDKYQRPAVVIGINDGEAKGSCRSITGVDIGAAIIEAQHTGIIEKGGGHAMAAGLSASGDQVAGLDAFLNGTLADAVAKAASNSVLKLDGLVAMSGATPDLMDALEAVGPFGAGNANPRFAISDVILVKVDRVGENHVRAIMKSKDGSSMKVMAFRQADEDLGQALFSGIGERFHIAGRLKSDDWTGQVKVEMTLEDLALA